MAPKEKAKELVVKLMEIDSDSDMFDGFKMGFFYSQRCALIAVDEIIKSREEDGLFDDTLSSTSSEYYTPHPMYLTYWQQVKQEIQKL